MSADPGKAAAPEAFSGPRPHSEARTAVENKSASFDFWVAYFYYSKPKFNPDDADRSIRQQLVQGLYEGFVKEHGQVIKSYFCGEFLGAVALTKEATKGLFGRLHDRYELHILFNILDGATGDEESVQLAELLYNCQQLARNANDLLEGPDLLVCLDLIYWIVGEALARLDENRAQGFTQGTVELHRSLLDTWKDKFEDAQEFYSLSAKRGAETKYFAGMMAGLLALLIVGVVAGVGLALSPASGLPLRELEGTFFGGAVGAIVSVMARMTKGKLTLDYEIGSASVFRIGMFRPVIGAVNATFVYFVLGAGLFRLTIPSGIWTRFFLFTGIAFVAGFSERLAQDMLGRVEGAFTSSPRGEPQATPGASRGRTTRTRIRSMRARMKPSSPPQDDKTTS